MTQIDDKIFWAIILSLISISFGWILNQLSQWFGTKKEDKRNLKKALYLLLEINYIFIKSDFENIIQKVTDKVYSKIPEDQQNEVVHKFLRSFYSKLMETHVKPKLIIDLKEVQKNYLNSIVIISSIDPIRAYYLGGRSNIFEVFDYIHNMIESIKEEIPTDDDYSNEDFNSVIQNVKSNIYVDALRELEMDIKKIAWNINPRTWIKSIIALRRIKYKIDNGMDKEIDKLFDSFLN